VAVPSQERVLGIADEAFTQIGDCRKAERGGRIAQSNSFQPDFAKSALATSIPREVSVIESEISSRSFSRLSDRVSDVLAAFALSCPASLESITSQRCT
jgi:hypothetical protein